MSKTTKENINGMICTTDEEGRVSKIEGVINPKIPNAEDITIEFENQSKDRFLLYFHDSNYWAIERTDWGMTHPIFYFKLLRDAEEAVNIIKRSV